jgi:hypothetical protein
MPNDMIIDGHSHVGDDKYNNRRKITLQDYASFCTPMGVNIGIIMPVPCPIIPENCGNLKPGATLISWSYDPESHMASDYSEDKVLQVRKLVNPYREINEYYRKKVECFDRSGCRLFYVPMLHPRLDTDEYLNDLISTTHPIALKIHSIGSFSSPKDMRQSYLEVIKKYNVPLIVHTDFNNGRYDKNPGLAKAVSFSSSEEWCDFFIINGMKGTLNHGAALSLDTLAKVNNSNLVKVALGPDLHLSDTSRLKVPDQVYVEYGYLGTLKRYLNADKIIFDVDYDYNNDYRGNYDSSSIERVKQTWDFEDCQKIFKRNAESHYELDL